MYIEEIRIDALAHYENNAKIHTEEQINQIIKSIKKFGFNDPIAVNANNVIIEGHGRVMAAERMGMETVQAIRLEHLTPSQEKAYILAHNKLTLNTGFDLDLLQAELEAITDIDMDDFGFDFEMPELDEEPDERIAVAEDDYEEPANLTTNVRTGDVWQLGSHRLICGDSTSDAVLTELMNGEVADLVFTDPPYGMKKEKDGVANDNLNYSDLLEFNKRWIPLSFKHMKANGSWYCWGIDEPLMDIYSNVLKPMIADKAITFRNLITWDKRQPQGMGVEKFRCYTTGDEKCLFVMCGTQGFDNNSYNYFEGFEPIRTYLESEWHKYSPKRDWDKFLGNYMGKHYFTKSQWQIPTPEAYKRLQETGWYKKPYSELKAEYEAIRGQYEQIKSERYSDRAYFDNTHDFMYNVWFFPITGQAERELAGGHATPKPIALCARGIMSSSREGEIVLDLFGGSGSTLIACEQLGRSCYMVEMSEHYCSVIINRWEQLTGLKAKKIN